MTQEELALALNITFQQVQKYEKGSNRVSAGRLQDIATALSVPPQFFYEGWSEAAEPAAEEALRLAQLMACSETVAIIQALASLKNPRILRLMGELASAIGEEIAKSGSAPELVTRQ